jgi:hypothetical protein
MKLFTERGQFVLTVMATIIVLMVFYRIFIGG